jgi:LPXTG-motif cell wall-anchored protein
MLGATWGRSKARLAAESVNSLTFGLVTGEQAWLWWTIAGAVVLAAALVWWVWRKGRPFAPGDVFRASRLSSTNHLFPTQVLISPTSVVQYKPRWIGRQEEVIHMAHIASVKIDTRVLLSDVLIETSGGSDPILCHGHHKRDAVAMKTLIERYQTDYYGGGGRSAPGAAPGPGGPVEKGSLGR